MVHAAAECAGIAPEHQLSIGYRCARCGTTFHVSMYVIMGVCPICRNHGGTDATTIGKDAAR